MKIKIRSIIFLIFVFLTANAQAYAATITGDAYGENIGIIHFDYTTAVNPFAACTTPATPNSVNCPLHADYGKYHLGAKRDFYLPPADDNYAALGTSGFTSNIESDLDLCTSQECKMDGFIWSDSIGWIAVGGNTIQTYAFGGDAGKFPSSDFARVSYSADPMKGIFKGYMWSEYTGWIKLSSDTFNYSNPATATNWGVWMDLSSGLTAPITNETCDSITDEALCTDIYTCQWKNSKCITRTIPVGRPLNGFAWSEKLGWIKFNKVDATDTSDFDFGAYSTWVPDTTEPILNIENYRWFANTTENGLITWDTIANDPESGIDVDNSSITITPVSSPDFDNCEELESDDIFSFTPPSHFDAITVNMPRIGILTTASEGFCAYKLGGNIKNTAGLTATIPAGIVFYVRAGDFTPSLSSFERSASSPESAIADGKDYISYTFSPKDISGLNPIVSVKVAPGALTLDGTNNVTDEEYSSNWVRNANIKYSFKSDEIFFNNLTPSNPTDTLPVIIDEAAVSSGTYYSEGPTITFPTDTSISSAMINNIQVASYAPTDDLGTVSDSRRFTLNQIEFTETDKIPNPPPYTFTEPPTYSFTSDPATYTLDEAVSVIGTTVTTDGILADDLSANAITSSTGASFEFTPAITTDNGKINTTTLIPSDDFITTSFDVWNQSTTASIGDISIDNSLDLTDEEDTGIGKAVLDIYDIKLATNTDGNFGRKDPINQGLTRYEMFHGFTDGSSTIFHSNISNFYPTVNYNFDFGGPAIGSDPIIDPDAIIGNGSYDITGTIIGGTDPIDIDRSDEVPFYLLSKTKSPQEISFKLGDLSAGQLSKSVTFSLSQYIAYRMSDGTVFPFDFAVYERPLPVIEGIEVKRVGVQATGIVSGEKVFQTISGREFQTVTSPGLSQLKQQMRDNVADITRGFDKCTTATPLSELSIPDDNNGCIKVDTNNNTVIAIYGNEASTLVLGDGTTDLSVPDGYKYTVIVTGGANVFIKNNIKYNTTGDKKTTSFGLIVLADTDSKGGNVYISPDVTNVVGLLYAEGSLLSSPDGTKLYYRDSDLNQGDIKNQLYWQGSIVSKNTIGGAANRTVPYDEICDEFEFMDDLNCARAFDMDYLRRFVVNSDGSDVGYVSDDARFSGGGSCSITPPSTDYVCAFPVGGDLPSKIQLSGALIDIPNSKTDPFYIEKDTRPAPPGFSTSAGFERTQEIR